MEHRPCNCYFWAEGVLFWEYVKCTLLIKSLWLFKWKYSFLDLGGYCSFYQLLVQWTKASEVLLFLLGLSPCVMIGWHRCSSSNIFVWSDADKFGAAMTLVKSDIGGNITVSYFHTRYPYTYSFLCFCIFCILRGVGPVGYLFQHCSCRLCSWISSVSH